MKHRPTNSPGPAVMTAAAQNTIGRTSHAGGPVVDRLVKKMTLASAPRSTVTGLSATNATNTASAIGE